MKPIFGIPFIVILVGVSAAAYYFYDQNQRAQELLKDSSKVVQNENKALIEKVGKLIQLPPDEEPTVATVNDKEAIRSQPFFASAEIGDKVIVYVKAKKAFLFRPSQNKIIEVGPVTTDEDVTPQASSSAKPTSTAQAVTQTTSSTISVAIFNGTDNVGITSRIADDLQKQISGLDIVNKESANRKDYAETLVVDISGRAGQKLTEIAAALSGTVGGLPEGEKKPEADVLVIVGADNR